MPRLLDKFLILSASASPLSASAVSASASPLSASAVALAAAACHAASAVVAAASAASSSAAVAVAAAARHQLSLLLRWGCPSAKGNAPSPHPRILLSPACKDVIMHMLFCKTLFGCLV